MTRQERAANDAMRKIVVYAMEYRHDDECPVELLKKITVTVKEYYENS